MIKDSKGVSPVVASLLLIAVSVALVSLLSVEVFELLNDTSESPDVNIEAGYYESANELEVTALRNENTDRIFLSGESLDSDVTLFTGGETGRETVTVSSGTYFIIAEINGSETVVQKITIN